MLELGQPLAQVIASAGAGAGLAGVVMALRRRLARDNAEIKAESHLVAGLINERDQAHADARACWLAHRADAAKIAALEAHNQHQARELERLRTEFAAFKRLLARLYPETRPFLVSDFQPMPTQ